MNCDMVFGIVLAIFMVPLFLITLFTKNGSEEKYDKIKDSSTYILSSKFFILRNLNNLFFICFIVIIRNYSINIYLSIFALMLVFIPSNYFLYKHLKKIKKLSKEEPEYLLLKKIKEDTMLLFVASAIVTLIFLEGSLGWVIWFGSYAVGCDTLGWYYYRKNEKEIQQNPENK